MVIIRLMGGLGNQMFQYAFYQRFRQNYEQVKMDLSGYNGNRSGDKRKIGLDRFPNVSFEVCTKKERAAFIDDSMAIGARIARKIRGCNTKIIREKDPYREEILKVRDGYLLGYWNCEKYYEAMLPLLREHFQFPESHDSRNREMEKMIKESVSVSLHIRRGDYMEPRYAERFGSICTEDYYDKAIQYIRETVDHPSFFIFSDDKEYIQQKYKDSCFHVIDWNQKEEDTVFDMYLMSLCKHNICANSTFSKWAAILNNNPDKIRINPMKQTKDDEIPWEIRKELWKGWVFIDESAQVFSS